MVINHLHPLGAHPPSAHFLPGVSLNSGALTVPIPLHSELTGVGRAPKKSLGPLGVAR